MPTVHNKGWSVCVWVQGGGVRKSASIRTCCSLIRGPRLVCPRHVSEPYEEWVGVCVCVMEPRRALCPHCNTIANGHMGQQGWTLLRLCRYVTNTKKSPRPSPQVTKTPIFARQKKCPYWANKTLTTHFGRFIWQSERD